MRLIESSALSNQSLVAALLTHTYTADADRALYIRLFANQIAGNGDYVAYVTVTRLGAGSAYRMVPITTATIAAGVTAAALTTIMVPIKATDVARVYLTGLAGDTTTPDIITEIWEDDAGADTAGTTTLLSRLSDTRAGYLDNLSAGAVALQSTLSTVATNVSTALTNIAAVPAAVWSYVSRTLTQPAQGVIAAVTGGPITTYRGTTWVVPLTGLSDFTGWTKILVAVKKDPDDADSASVGYWQVSNPADAVNDGLIYLNGAPATKSDGSITVVSTTALTIGLVVGAADDVPLWNGLYYGIKAIDAAGVDLVSIGGRWNVAADIPKAIA